MTSKNVKKLSRSELLRLLIKQMEENELLNERINELENQLENRRIINDNVGSIADAALMINNIFDVAQTAADQYLTSVRELSEDQEAICRAIIKKAEEEAQLIIDEANAYKKRTCEAADVYWKQMRDATLIPQEERDNFFDLINSAKESSGNDQ